MLRPADPLLQSPGGFVQEHFLFKASYNDRKLQITYSLKHSQTTAYDRYDRLIQQTNGQPDQAEWRYAPQLWSSHLLHLRYTKKNQLFDAADLRVACNSLKRGASAGVSERMNGSSAWVGRGLFCQRRSGPLTGWVGAALLRGGMG